MTLTGAGGYRFAPCVVCKERAEAGLQRYVKPGRCYIRGVGDVCPQHFHMLQEARNGE